MRHYVWALGLLLFVLGGCEDDVATPTDVYVSFKTDLAIGSEVSAVRVRVFRGGDSPATATPLSEHTVSADNLTKKLPLVLEKRDANDFLLAAQALGPAGASDPVIERHVKARFQDGQTVSLQVFLGRACLRKACPIAGDTCYGEMHGLACEGSCGPLDEPELLPPWSVTRADWQPTTCSASSLDGGMPARDAGGDATMRSDAGPDAGMCVPTLPGASCDAITQCGCTPGKSCGVAAVNGSTLQLGCLDVGNVPSGSACSTDSCVPGNTCVGSLCRAFCGKDADCGSAGHCVTATTNDANATPITGLSACFAGCNVDSDCPGTGCCRALPSAPNAGKLCLTADACCAQAGASCSANSDCCGAAQNAAACVSEPSGGAICRATCTQGSDCNSGCCADLTGGGKACFAASQCQSDCAAANEACQVTSDCCGGASNTAVCVPQGAGPICANRCTSNAQCMSGCCAPLTDGSTVCAPQVYCQ